MAKNTNDTELTKAIERLDFGRGKSYSQLFDNFLDFTLSFHCGNPNETQVRVFEEAKQNTELWERYVEAMKCYETSCADYHEPLGDVFMERISHGDHGQFFTPQHMCELMAEITIGETEGSIYDCACGSGRLLLAGLKKARERGNNPAVFAGDISYTCCRMVLLNLLTQCAHGEVQQGDTLRLNLEGFTFYKMENVALIGKGVCFSQYWQYTLQTAEEVQKERQEWYRQMAFHGVFPYDMEKKKQEPEPSPMAIGTPKQEVYKQLTLF